ncbi:UDP-N-acetylmuramoylalanine--D-glutamate ligase [bacterium BMS3Bbin06]|nr:UDP-N-acetylmuramoylalanine--D-glutamate ligase [bacterium BMS3Abin08]GBE34353.1 UDP-N-acetylmuramoylalanine--D-glutamate ligase [bacterium BMS3Bbin06]HDO34797.1 UDP-N-acetylmuramoyl-L-alanine--D-glutamate ligase [Nitrospirota bacterium]HDY72320.1 UDP-N-acetylmuramoyl-L-alanine--D-glutamate ligase [Nitrospirota bacterium]
MEDLSSSFKDRRFLVVGLGRSGLSAAGLLRFLGADVVVSDDRDKKALAGMMGGLPEGIVFRPASAIDPASEGIDEVVISPGIPMFHPLVKRALSSGIEVIGELELGFRVLMPFRIPWIGITGTNGKSTTTRVTELMLKRAGRRILSGGNIGNAITGEILGGLRGGTLSTTEYVLVEISSFQLEGIRAFKPSVAVVLNISPDHLDRYEDLDEYIRTKAAIYRNQGPEDTLVLNLGDENLRCFAGGTGSKVRYFSVDSGTGGEAGAITPDAYVDEGWLFLRSENGPERIIRIDDMRIRGIHNQENALAALLISSLCGVTPDSQAPVLREFKGLEHRMEFVDEVEGVSFYNDSKGTNIGAVMKSLDGFGDGVILILGGKYKGGDFSGLKRYIGRRMKAAVLVGEARGNILKQMGNPLCAYLVDDMDEAVVRAFSLAERGDTVLLSPGCASFDMFDDFEHRGRHFKELVRKLKGGMNVRV